MDFQLFNFFEEKARGEAEAYEVATSTYRIINDGSIIPYAEDEGREILRRISGLVTSMGAKVLNRKLDGVVGNLTVDGYAAKEFLREHYDLKDISEKLARDLIVKGAAGLALADGEDGTDIYRLGGFITTLTDPDDVDKVNSIFQAQAGEDANTWTVRIYQGGLVQEWRNVRNLRDILNTRPVERESGITQIAFFASYQTDDAGTPIGEMEQLTPILKGIMAVEARIHRVSEIFGYPVPVIKGTIQERPAHSPTSAIIVNENGDVKYLTPADMQNLIGQKKDLVKQLDDIAILPAGQTLGYEPPSGEALKEANEAFNVNVERYASKVTDLLTRAFTALLTARGISTEGFSIQLFPNYVRDEELMLEKAIQRLEAGLLPIGYVVRLLRGYYGDMTDAEAEEVIEAWKQREMIITPESLGL